jgi:hypothetical protein
VKRHSLPMDCHPFAELTFRVDCTSFGAYFPSKKTLNLPHNLENKGLEMVLINLANPKFNQKRFTVLSKFLVPKLRFKCTIPKTRGMTLALGQNSFRFTCPTVNIAENGYTTEILLLRQSCVVAEQETFSVFKPKFNNMKRRRINLAHAMTTTARYLNRQCLIFRARLSEREDHGSWSLALIAEEYEHARVVVGVLRHRLPRFLLWGDCIPFGIFLSFQG